MADITITEGDTLEVDYSLENTGDGTGTFDPRLLVQGVQEDQDTGITLDPAQTATGTLQWPTVDGDAVTDALAEAVTDDTSDSITVTVEEASTIPDSGLVHRYDASSLSLSDGNTVSTFTDTQGSADLSATGAPTYQSGALNGNDAVVYDGVGDYHYGPLTSTLTQPNTVAMAFQLNSVDGNQQIIVGGDDGSGNSSHNSDVESGSWLMFAGDPISGGSEDTLSHCRVDLYDGTSSVLDLDNTQIVSGDAGTRQISNVALAAAPSAVGFADLTIGEVLIYDTAKTNGERAEIYNYLSSKWGV